MTSSPPPPKRDTLTLPHAARPPGTVDIAVERRAGSGTGLFWMSGFMSDMAGGKAMALDGWAADMGHPCTRFDYSGHGVSGGDIRQGTIGQWLSEARAVFARTTGPQVVVGSSMGGYLGLLLALAERADHGAGSRVAGLLLIAPALDMTERLMWDEMSDEDRDTLHRDGVLLKPSDYGDTPYPLTAKLIEEGRDHLLTPRAPLDLGCPVHILQGRLDVDVPLRVVLDLVDLIDGDVDLTVINSGDHRLSRPEDLDRLVARAAFLTGAAAS